MIVFLLCLRIALCSSFSKQDQISLESKLNQRKHAKSPKKLLKYNVIWSKMVIETQFVLVTSWPAKGKEVLGINLLLYKIEIANVFRLVLRGILLLDRLLFYILVCAVVAWITMEIGSYEQIVCILFCTTNQMDWT